MSEVETLTKRVRILNPTELQDAEARDLLEQLVMEARLHTEALLLIVTALTSQSAQSRDDLAAIAFH